MFLRLVKGILILATFSVVVAVVVSLSGKSSSQDAGRPQRDPPDGFRGIKWDSVLPSTQKLRETALVGCTTIVEQKGFTDSPPCSHMHIDTDDMELFAQRRNVAPIFGIAASEQMLTWSYRKFWSGQAFFYNYRDDDLAKLRAALIDQYGSATATLDRIIRWRWLARKIEIQLSYDPVAKPSLGSDKTRRTSISLLFSRTE